MKIEDTTPDTHRSFSLELSSAELGALRKELFDTLSNKFGGNGSIKVPTIWALVSQILTRANF